MNRRDTIMVAVLVNAGILVALFAIALKSNPDSEMELQEPKTTLVKEDIIHKEPDLLTAVESAPEVAIPEPSQDPIAVVPEIPVKEELIAHSAEAPKPIAVSSSSVVIVKSGDTLDKIAKRQGTTVQAILRHNKLASSKLKIGQKLKIPQKNSGAAVAVSHVESASYYIVKKGDNPWSIATKNKIKVEELLRLNNLTDQKARNLKPGDRLRVR